jgi:glycosyltransferase involved in cell wall biosynthesis
LKQKRNVNSTKLPAKNIFFVWNYLQWGGAQIYFLALMRSIADKFAVKAVLPEGSDKKLLQYLEANHIEYDFYKGSMDGSKAESVGRRIERRWNDFVANLSLAKHLSQYELKNSIVQIDVAPWAGFALLFYLIFKTNVFVTFHTALPELSFLRRSLWKTKFALLTASRRFQIAASNLDVKKSLRPFVSASRYHSIEIVYSSVNAEEIKKVLDENKKRREISEKYNFPLEKTWVCNVAQFIERKGCWVFLEAIKMLQEQRSDLFFYWLGTAPLSVEIREKIGEYDLGKNFRYLAGSEAGDSRHDLLTLLKGSDLFVLPSFQEGLPVALLEAMALGKACIASRINAIPEAIEHFKTGVLVEAGDAERLAKAIGALADDELLRKRLGENAQRTVLENFEEKVIGQKMLRLYESIKRGV